MTTGLSSRTAFATALMAGCLIGSPLRAQGPSFQVPPGFVVEKVAGAPLVRYPLFAAFDDRGRLFVAEGTGTNLPGAELAKKKLGRILMLEDTDGDGKFDKSTVFADDLVFPQGVLWHDGALFAASHPSFWRFEEIKGLGKADRRTELATGFKFNGNGCDIHGPFLGPDGRLYWTDGRHGYQVKTQEGPTLEGFAARIWRCRPDGSELERICGGGFDNPVELAFTAEGEMIGTMDQGPGDCLLHFIDGGVYPMEHPCIKEFPRTGSLLGAVQKYSEALPAALCGTMRYRSGVFGAEYKDALFTTHYMTHKVVRTTLIRDGSTFRAQDNDFLVSSDPHLRLTDVLEDADGSLLGVDMGSWFTYGFLGNPLARPEGLGAIYRIRNTKSPKVIDPWGKNLNLDKRSPKELATLLDDPRPAVRDGTVQRLSKSGGGGLEELEAVVRSKQRSVQARRNAVWALCRMNGEKAREVNHLALTDEDMRVRMAAVHAAGLHRDPKAAVFLVNMMKLAEPPLRRKVAEALGRIGKGGAIPVLLDELRRGGNDRFLEHALIYALIQIEDRAATLVALSDPSPRVRRGGLIALDQMKNGNLTRSEVVPLLHADDSALQHAALEIVARRPDWASAAHDVIRIWLAKPQLSESQEKTLKAVLLAGSGETALEQLVGDGLKNPKLAPATRRLLIDVVGSSRSPLPTTWALGLSQTLTHTDPGMQREALTAVHTRKWRQFDVEVLELSRQTKLPTELRLAALECLAGRGLDAEAFAFLSNQLAEATEPLLRLSAARTLAASALTNEQLTRLADNMRRVNTMTLRMLLPLFSKTGDAQVGASLGRTLEKAPAAEGLTLAEIDRVLKRYPVEVRQAVATLREKLANRQKGQAAYLAGLTVELDRLDGDPDVGKEIFLSPKHGCYACHRAVGRGGNVGPDLSQIGRFRTRAELLESIIFPNLSIAPQYATHQVTTKDGRSWAGLIVRESTDAIFLRTTDLAEIRILRKDVDDLVPSPVSLMPDGLERTMTRQELRNLLEFLTKQR